MVVMRVFEGCTAERFEFCTTPRHIPDEDPKGWLSGIRPAAAASQPDRHLREKWLVGRDSEACVWCRIPALK
jgi:hypothetical protein